RRLPKCWDNVPGEQLDLPHLFVQGDKSLVEEPTKPLQFAITVYPMQCLDFALHLIDRTSQSVFDITHALKRPLRWGQRRERIGWILYQIFGSSKRFPKPERAEIGIKTGIVRAPQQLHGLSFGRAKMDRTKRAYALSQSQFAPGRGSHFLVDFAQTLKLRRVRNEN